MKLYHISPQASLAGRWVPDLPAGLEDSDSGGDGFPYPEPALPRISVSTDLLGAFQAIYPNHRNHILRNRPQFIEFHVYIPKSIPRGGLVTNQEILKNRYVWDAHITHEKWITKPVIMDLVGRVRFRLGREYFVWTQPFNDRSLPRLRYRHRDVTIEDFLAVTGHSAMSLQL